MFRMCVFPFVCVCACARVCKICVFAVQTLKPSQARFILPLGKCFPQNKQIRIFFKRISRVGRLSDTLHHLHIFYRVYKQALIYLEQLI